MDEQTQGEEHDGELGAEEPDNPFGERQGKALLEEEGMQFLNAEGYRRAATRLSRLQSA